MAENIKKKQGFFMSEKEYIDERLQGQIDWHQKKASWNKDKYRKIKMTEFILAASIPVVISLSAMGIFESSTILTIDGVIGKTDVSMPVTLSTVLQILAATAGVILTILNKVVDLDEYFSNWKEYRAIAEFLEHQKILYVTRTYPYNTPQSFQSLVATSEDYLAKEIQKWQQQESKIDNSLTESTLGKLSEMQNSWKTQDDSAKYTKIDKKEQATPVIEKDATNKKDVVDNKVTTNDDTKIVSNDENFDDTNTVDDTKKTESDDEALG